MVLIRKLVSENENYRLNYFLVSKFLKDIGWWLYWKEYLALPDFKEQQKIADCLSSIDELIDAESRKLKALEKYKKGLMQKLFPAVGIVLALVGGFKLFMAFRNDQPDAYSGAAKDIVIGVVLATFATVVWPVISAQF